MKRNEFIKKSLLLSTGALVASRGFAGSIQEPESLVTILYTNDTHARIDPFPPDDGKYAGLGGISRRAALVKRIRNQSPHILLLDAGDVFHGTPWFHMYGGRIDLRLMSKMGYDAMCLGEHEFTNGLDGFDEVAPAADFPFLCANYRVKDTPLAPLVRQYLIREKAGVRIGIFGLGQRLERVIRPELFGDIRYGNPVAWAETMVQHLRERYRCDYIICLSHLGYHYRDEGRMDDRKLASNVNGINLIVGGHSHIFLDRPERVTAPDGTTTLVTQAGHSGIRLGHIDLAASEHGELKEVAACNYKVGEGTLRG